MAGYLQNKKTYDPYMGAAQYQEDEASAVPDMYVPQSEVVVPEKQSMDYGQVAQGAATGASMGGPAGAAIGAGGSFLTQYIAQRAADERAKRQAIGQAYQNQAANEQNIINSIMATNARALR